jgi:hypothetical protein
MASPATPLPPVLFEDGFGQRRRVVGARNQTLSVLFLDAGLTADPAFETALRERLADLAGFHHESFARARGVVHVTKAPLRLALASDFVEGVRLSEMLVLADERLIPLEIGAAFSVIRQLTAALAALHQHGGASHGALAPERVIVTSDGRLVVTEYVLGLALERLQFAPPRYWKELRIALPPGAAHAQLDRRADVAQLGAIALALIVGRPLREDEYPSRISEIVDSVRAISATGLEPLPTAVRAWLRSALQLDARTSFASAAEAHAALDGIFDVDERTARQALRTFAATCQKTLLQEDAVAEPPTLRVAPSLDGAEASARTVLPAPQARGVESTPELRVPDLRIVPRPEPTGRLFASFDDGTPAAPAPAAPAQEAEPSATETTTEEPVAVARRIWHQHRLAALAIAVVIIGSAVTLAARSYFASAPMGTLIVNTNPSGVTVVIDGQHRGSTPLTLDLSPGSHVLQIVSDGHVRKIPVTIAEGRELAQFVELPAVAPAPTDGQLQVRSEPSGARVLIDGQYHGVAPLTIEALSPGTHTIKVEDGTASVTQQVTIEAGITASLVVPLTAPRNVPVSGWISVAAPVDVQIYENQRLLGSSRSEQIMVAAGRHDVEIVNELLGYRVTRTVQVAPGETASIKLEWPNGSIAFNAQPWADVWLDGQHLGETPIGNVQVPIGPHRVVFRHPELGEQTQNVSVTLTAPARISADMRTR